MTTRRSRAATDTYHHGNLRQALLDHAVELARTGGRPAELFRRALAPLTAYTALVHLVGVDRGNGNVRYLRATLAAKRLGGGAILVNDVGGQPYRLLADHRDGSAGTWAIAPSVAGNDVVITVTGAAGRTIDWFLRIEVDAFTPGGVP